MEDNEEYKSQKFDKYLNKVIVGASLNYFKREAKINGREKTLIDDTNYTKVIEDTLVQQSYEDFTNEFEKKELISAIEKLSNIEQTVLFLLFSKDISRTEAAKILKICDDTVSRIKKRVIEKLREELKGDGENEE